MHGSHLELLVNNRRRFTIVVALFVLALLLGVLIAPAGLVLPASRSARLAIVGYEKPQNAPHVIVRGLRQFVSVEVTTIIHIT